MSTEEHRLIIKELGEIRKLLDERLPVSVAVYNEQKRCFACTYPQFWLVTGPALCNKCGLPALTNG